MQLTRRSLLTTGAAALVTATAAASANRHGNPRAAATDSPRSLPDKDSFALSGTTYLDNGSQHPIPIVSRRAVEPYFAARELTPQPDYRRPDDAARAKFARLINAEHDDEIGYVYSTTAAEQMILRGLGLPHARAHVVVDTLHFFGSFPMYLEMARRGVTVSWVRDRNGRIELADLKAAIRKDTRLIALSSISMTNGFQHDLKAVCDLAHEAGALVYADIIQQAGCVPLEVSAMGLDFAACATYKWLMGDFGLGFVYARRSAMAQLARSEYGYHGLTKFESHVHPFDPPGDSIAEYDWEHSAEGQFATGTKSYHVIPILDRSLDYISSLGVTAIQQHAQKLTDHLKRELPRLGYKLMTPPGTTSPIVACILENARDKLGQRLADRNVKITLRKHSFRITPSVYNDEADIETLLSALHKA